jgi:hypothetical protein
VQEADHDVRHLHAGVVDVVLHADVEAAVAQQPHEGVSQAGVADVAHVGGLVRVDAGVLDDHVARPRRRRQRLGQRAVQRDRETAPVEEQVDVAAARDLGAHHVAAALQAADELLRDLARLSAQGAGEVERRGERQVAELDARGVLEGNGSWIDVECGPSRLLHRPRKALLEIQDHRPFILACGSLAARVLHLF